MMDHAEDSSCNTDTSDEAAPPPTVCVSVVSEVSQEFFRSFREALLGGTL